MADTIHPFLITAFALPYEASGTSIVTRRLIENLHPGEAVLLGRAPNRNVKLVGHALPIPAVQVRWLPLGLRGERFSRLAAVAPSLMQGLAAVRRHRCRAILAMFPDEGSLLTGYLIHRITRLPLLAYFCDLYMEDRRGSGWEARLARWLQPRVFLAASRLLAVNRGMSDFYMSQYGIETVTVPTCINQGIPEFTPPPAVGNPVRIAYSGNVNDTRLDTLRILVRAVGSDPGYAIRYFTPQTPDQLGALGVWSANASAEFVADDATLVRRLRECDVLYLPLTFDLKDHSREQMATCFGIKAYEYFLAGRPVLVHCPADYFLARFFRDAGCGVVVDDPSPHAVSLGLKELAGNSARRIEVVRRGFEAARTFEGARVAAILRGQIAVVMAAAEGGVA
jgi:hypothetical protein